MQMIDGRPSEELPGPFGACFVQWTENAGCLGRTRDEESG